MKNPLFVIYLMKLIKKVVLFAALVGSISPSTHTSASPPCCTRNDCAMFIDSDAVVSAMVKQSKRRSEGKITLHLVATYQVLDVFKGNVRKGDILIVTDTCIDEPVPEHVAGYPNVENYCRNGIGLHLTGVNSTDGSPAVKSGEKPKVILFLKKNIRKGAPQLTWLEMPRTSFYGGCWRSIEDISPEERERFDRFQQRLKDIGSQ